MRAHEFLTEGLSAVVYHYTNIDAAMHILNDQEFQLSSSVGGIEEQYAPAGYPYYFSTARTKYGSYMNYVGNQAVMFNLNGNWYNQRYPSKSIDYWGNRGRGNVGVSGKADHEAEDRLFSKTPAIPINGILAIHVFNKKGSGDPSQNAVTRKVLLKAKALKIPTYFYNDETAWRNQNTHKVVNIADLSGNKPTGYTRPNRKYLDGWLQLAKAHSEHQLSEPGKAILYKIRYHNYNNDIVNSLSADISNNRKPNSGPMRNDVIKIIDYMRTHKLNTTKDFIDHLVSKWETLAPQDN